MVERKAYTAFGETEFSEMGFVGHMKFSGTHWKCIEYLTSLVPLIDEK